MHTDDIESTFRKHYPRYQYIVVDYFADHLADCSRSFNGDMQMVVLLAIIGQVYLSATIAADAAGRTLADSLPEKRGITTNRLSDATGIPRETARRKLQQMEDTGWIKREGSYWVLTQRGETTNAQRDLEALDNRGIKRTARLFSLLHSLVENKETQRSSTPRPS